MTASECLVLVYTRLINIYRVGCCRETGKQLSSKHWICWERNPGEYWVMSPGSDQYRQKANSEAEKALNLLVWESKHLLQTLNLWVSCKMLHPCPFNIIIACTVLSITLFVYPLIWVSLPILVETLIPTSIAFLFLNPWTEHYTVSAHFTNSLCN